MNRLSEKEALTNLNVETKKLWAIFEKLNDEVTKVEARLAAISPGVSTWILLTKDGPDKREIGYTKLNKKWGITLRTWQGGELEEAWLFRDAPAWLRLDAIPKIPELIEAMTERIEEASALAEKRLIQIEEFLEKLA